MTFGDATRKVHTRGDRCRLEILQVLRVTELLSQLRVPLDRVQLLFVRVRYPVQTSGRIRNMHRLDYLMRGHFGLLSHQ